MLERTVDVHLVELAHDPRPEPLAQREDAGALGLALLRQDVARLAEADDEGHGERARAHPTLVPSAVHLRDEAYARLAPPYVERSDALRPVDLVSGDRRKVDVHALHVEVD